MAEIISGIGNGKSLAVDNNNRAQTSAMTLSEASTASRNGDAYNINTGDITLTTANESSVLYVKNNEVRDLIVTTVIFLIGSSTGGTGDLVTSVFSNTTIGTVVDDAVDVEMKENKNFGNSNSLAADAFVGSEGKTLTNGTKVFSSRLDGAAKQYSIGTGDIILPKGSSMGIKITPQTSNTSVTLQVALATYLREDS